MSSHFHFHNDRKLSSNTTNSSLPNQARINVTRAKNMLFCLHTFTFTMTGTCLPTQTVTSPHFPFHDDRKLSYNTTNSSLPNQARLTICFQLPGSCLSFKLWKNATTVTSPHFPFHDDRRLSYKLLKD